MSVSFVKYCPLCDEENLSIASFCAKCDADLMNAPVVMRRPAAEGVAENGDEGAEQENTAKPPAAPALETAPTAAVENQSAANQHVDENELVTRRADLGPGGVLELELVANPAVRFQVRPGQSVGRSPRADVVLKDVPDLEYISRAHARFTRRRTQWYVQYIAEGNCITVDGVESRDDAEVAIYDQSIVVLSFSPFRVRLS